MKHQIMQGMYLGHFTGVNIRKSLFLISLTL